MKDEKHETEKEIESLEIPRGVIVECISMRDNRQRSELTHDEGETELKKVTSFYNYFNTKSLQNLIGAVYDRRGQEDPD